MSATETLTFLFYLLIFRSLASAAEPPPLLQTFKDQNMGIEFRYPLGFKLAACTPCDDGAALCIGFINKSPQKDGEGVDCSFYVEVGKGSLEEAISRHILFEKTEKGWTKDGRYDSSTAKEVKGAKLNALIAGASCGTSDEEGGFHAGAGVCITAFVSNGTQCATIESDGTLDESVINSVAKSFTFTRSGEIDNKPERPRAGTAAQ